MIWILNKLYIVIVVTRIEAIKFSKILILINGKTWFRNAFDVLGIS